MFHVPTAARRHGTNTLHFLSAMQATTTNTEPNEQQQVGKKKLNIASHCLDVHQSLKIQAQRFI